LLLTTQKKPTVLFLGDFPWGEFAYQSALSQLGSILRFETPKELLNPSFKSERLRIEGLFCGIHHKLTVAHLDRLPDLKVISNFGAGLDHLPL
jgi:lactate dehydrogenase-like 2-hydroxyacid dehydrogenase